MEEDDAMILLGDLQSFSMKLTAIERFFLERKSHIEGNYSIKKILEKARSINSFQNKIAHSLYLTDKTHAKVFLLAFASDPNKQIPMDRLIDRDATYFFELSETLLKIEIKKITDLVNSLTRLTRWLKPHAIDTLI
jgi:hypothetical protein